MRVGVIPENVPEWIGLMAGALPTPLAHTLIGLLLGRTIMVATRVGIFESLGSGSLDASEVAGRCNTQPAPTEKLLRALVSCRLLRLRADRYRLTRTARRWLLQASPCSLRDSILFTFVEEQAFDHLEPFLHSGEALDVHQMELSAEVWSLYHRGMRSRARLSSTEVAWRTPVPAGAREMLDIGGSHGHYAAAICRRHPRLRAVILDLPEAVAHAAPLLAEEGMGDRVVYRAGDALRDDLGCEVYDLVFISHLVHHFDEAANRELARRVARALRPGGVMVIQEVVRGKSPTKGGQIGGLMDLYFALTSASGTWSFAEMADWQREAGLRPRRPRHLRTLPGAGQQVAVKVAAS